MSTRSLNKLVWIAGEALRHSFDASTPPASDATRRFGNQAESERPELYRALQELDEYVRSLEAEKESARKESEDLRCQLGEQSERYKALQREVAVLRAKEVELRRLLVEAHHQLLHRDEEIQATLAHALRWAGRPAPTFFQEDSSAKKDEPHTANSPTENQIPSKHLQYQDDIRHIREAVVRFIPTDAVVLVVSKGDEELLILGQRKGWHFPQEENGGYAGYYPKDSDAAISHVEKLRERGAAYILFPAPSLWWLDFYADFKTHLANRYRCVHQDQHSVIFHLVCQPSGWWRRLWAKNSSRAATSLGRTV